MEEENDRHEDAITVTKLRIMGARWRNRIPRVKLYQSAIKRHKEDIKQSKENIKEAKRRIK